MPAPHLDLARLTLAGSAAGFAPASGDDYRRLASRLRDLAREIHAPYARRELLQLSGVYDRRAAYLDSSS